MWGCVLTCTLTGLQLSLQRIQQYVLPGSPGCQHRLAQHMSNTYWVCFCMRLCKVTEYGGEQEPPSQRSITNSGRREALAPAIFHSCRTEGGMCCGCISSSKRAKPSLFHLDLMPNSHVLHTIPAGWLLLSALLV